MDTKLKCVFELPDGVHQQTMTSESSKTVDAVAHYVSYFPCYNFFVI